MIFSSIALRKGGQSSFLAADVATHFNIVDKARMASLSQMELSSVGREARKKFPPASDHASGAVR